MLHTHEQIRTKLVKLIHDAEIYHKKHNTQIHTHHLLRSKLISLESEKALQECCAVLLDSTLKTVQNLKTQLEILLNKRWERIKNSCLSYTALSSQDREGYIQVLYIKIAHILYEISPSKSIYAYLMPSLRERIAEVLPLKRESIDDYALEECILDDANHYLLPVSEILNYYHKSAVLYHPFTGEIYSTQEETRLWRHSNTTEFLRSLLNQLATEEVKHFSLGKSLNELIQALRNGGVSRNQGGRSEEASTPALIGILNFKLTWDTFSEEDRLCASECTDNFGYTLQHVISILTKEDQTTFDCVEYLAFTLATILKRYPKLYWIGNTCENIEILANLRNTIETVYHSIEMHPYGSDKFPHLTPKLSQVFSDSTLTDAVPLLKIADLSTLSLETLHFAEMTLQHHLNTLKDHQVPTRNFFNFLNPFYFFRHWYFKTHHSPLLSFEISITQKLINILKGIHPTLTPEEMKALLECTHLRMILSKYAKLVPEFEHLLHLQSPFKLEVLSEETLITQL